MLIDAVTHRLRQTVPLFGGRVFGALTLEAAMDDARPDAPAAFVLFPQEDARLESGRAGYAFTEISRVVPVAFELKKGADTLGHNVAREAEIVRYELLRSLVNWQAETRFLPTGFKGLVLAAETEERAWFIATFVMVEQINVECFEDDDIPGMSTAPRWALRTGGASSACGPEIPSMGDCGDFTAPPDDPCP